MRLDLQINLYLIDSHQLNMMQSGVEEAQSQAVNGN